MNKEASVRLRHKIRELRERGEFTSTRLSLAVEDSMERTVRVSMNIIKGP